MSKEVLHVDSHFENQVSFSGIIFENEAQQDHFP